MNISEKLLQIAENEQKVYDAGYEIGKAEGRENSDILSSFVDGSITKIVIPKGTTIIREYMFYNSENLERVIIPNSVTRIKWQAFYGCKSLKNITIPEGIKTIERYSFANSGLTEISFPPSVEAIETGAFQGCEKLVLYDFSKSTAVPVLADNLSVNTNAEILVPSSLYNEWVTATNWVKYKDYIVAVDVKAEPDQSKFNIYVDANTLQEIINYDFLGVKLGHGIGENSVINEGLTPYLRIYGDGASDESYAIVQNIENRKTGKYLIFAYRLPVSNVERHNYFQVYANTTSDKLTGRGDMFNVETIKDGKWHVEIIDLEAAINSGDYVNNGTYPSKFVANSDGTYTLNRLRIDWFNEVTSKDSYIDIAYIGLCDNLADARIADKDYITAEFKADYFVSKLGSKATKSTHNDMEYVTITSQTNSGGESTVYLSNTDPDLLMHGVAKYVGVLYRNAPSENGYFELHANSASELTDSKWYSNSKSYWYSNSAWRFEILPMGSKIADTVCRNMRFDYFNGLSGNATYSIDIAFVKCFASEEEAQTCYEKYKTRYNI